MKALLVVLSVVAIAFVYPWVRTRLHREETD
jgi:membrane protein implicated in regulation of membrane protease activity